MIVLSKEEFKKFLDGDEVTFTFGDGDDILDISPAISIVWDGKNEPEIKHTGYEIVRYENGDVVFQESFEDFEKAAEYASEFVPFADTVTANKISGFGTLEEFYDERKFRDATMDELLEKYADCNEFSLTCSEDGIITRAQADEIIEKERESAEKECKVYYDTAVGKVDLPPFETVLKEVRDECAEFTVKKRKKFPEKKYGKYIAGFICDFVADEKTKYFGDDFWWHFYIALGRERDNIDYINDRVSIAESGEDVFALSDCGWLREKVLRVDTGFENHCTKTSELLTTYYFPLDETTRRWLAGKKDDFDFDYGCGFADLAFYKNGKIRFSSCTHEHFHNDVSE